MADAQLLVLQAIYHELRHGHDEAVRRTEAMTAYTEAMTAYTEALAKPRGALADHADVISRHRRER